MGSGGVAYVIAALHLELGEMVALKFLRPESLAYEDVVVRFSSEARAVARIKSEHVAHVFDVGALPDGTPFIVMEYLEGKDLADVLAEQRRLPIKVAVDYVLQACEALACAHAGGIVHRDIKPENLFLTQQAANIQGREGARLRHLQKCDVCRRIPRAKDREDDAADGHAGLHVARADPRVRRRRRPHRHLGARLRALRAHHRLVGVRCADGGAARRRHPRARAVPLRQVMPEAPAELEAVILRCLEKDPNHRFQDVAELAAALYPFGPRRARLSAERCHQVLKGQHGVVIEFNSVPPPSFGDGHTPLPVSSTSAFTSATPVSASPPHVLRTSTPATLSVIEYPRPKSRGRLFVGLAVALAAACGVALALRTHAEPPTALGAAVSPVVPPAPAVATVAPAERAAAATTSSPSAETTATDTDTAKAAKGGVGAKAAPSASSPAARAAAARARATRAQHTAAANDADVKSKALGAKRRAGLDDAEPDVGY